jgi:hypothetical protein
MRNTPRTEARRHPVHARIARTPRFRAHPLLAHTSSEAPWHPVHARIACTPGFRARLLPLHTPLPEHASFRGTLVFTACRIPWHAGLHRSPDSTARVDPVHGHTTAGLEWLRESRIAG